MMTTILRRGVLCLALACLPVPLAAGQGEAGQVQAVFASINAVRERAGCPALRLDRRLSAAAKGHASAMAEQDFFGHAGADGNRFAARITRAGYSYRAAAENIAAGQSSANEVVRGWLQSAGHRRNILNCAMRETGIGVVYQRDDRPIRGNRSPLRWYWVQIFATP